MIVPQRCAIPAFLALLLLPACDVWGGEHVETETLTLAGPIRLVDTRLDAAELILIGEDREDAEIEYEITYRGSQPDVFIQVTEETLSLQLLCPEGSAGFCNGRFQATVPATAAAALRSTAGAIEARDLQGDLELATTAGDVKLSAIGGDLDLTATSGDVRGEDLGAAKCSAFATTGSFELALVGQPVDVDVQTGSGGVGLTVPQGGYNIWTETVSGTVTLDRVVHDANASATIDVITDSGNISILGF